MKYGVIGTGAIGGYYGARLAQGGQEVHFLLRSDYDYVRQHGLQIDSCDGSFHLDAPHVYNTTADMPQCDVVLVCLKSINNHKLRDLLPPLLGPHTLVVLIQNGIGVEQDVEQLFPGIQLVAGLAFICSAKTEPGRVNHQCYGQINLGNYSCRDEALLQQVVDDFNAAGVKAGLVEYHEARWKKTVWNMPFNGMTVALKTQTNLLLQNPATRQLIYEQMMEVIGAAQHLGVKNIDESFAQKMLEMTDAMTPYSPSMRLDYDFHRRMEIHYLYTRPIEMAREAGFDMPKLAMLEAELKFLDITSSNFL
ncbi:MAG: putative 2-dehydropantoate 2-reductase [Prevotella sp.]|jgi:2-dehydropantoate 2-reductase|nr:putative 2-dehydropantoate 2-reductase [Prevotella sp.]